MPFSLWVEMVDMLCLCWTPLVITFSFICPSLVADVHMQNMGLRASKAAHFLRSLQPHLTAQDRLLVQQSTSKMVPSAKAQSINVLLDLQLHRMHLVDGKIHPL